MAEPVSGLAPRQIPDDALRHIRSAFPVLDRVTYMNTGTYGPMPDAALKTYMDAVADLERDGVACQLPLAQQADDLRTSLARMVGAGPHELAFTGNATDGINIVLSGMGWREGDEVITTDEEHEAMLHPLLYIQRTKGVRVRRISCSHRPDDVIAQLDALHCRRTRLLAFSHVTCETGTLLPAAEMCAWAASRSVQSLLDVAQSLGATPVNVGAIGCDYMASNGHKWLHGPKGTGYLYVHSSRIGDIRPAHVGAGSLEQADPLSGAAEPWNTAARFEFGTRPWSRAAGWQASLQWLEHIGYERIWAHALALGDAAIAALDELEGVDVLTPRDCDGRAGLISIRLHNQDAGVVGTRLSEHAIVTRHVPHYNALRFSMSHFTDTGDIARLAGGLHHVLAG